MTTSQMSRQKREEAKPFDPQARYVDPETGLEYQDFAAWILREPTDSRRNVEVIALKECFAVTDEVIRAFWRAHDCITEGYYLAFAAGYDAAARACHPDSYDASRFHKYASAERQKHAATYS